MTILELADLIKKYGLEERGMILSYNSNDIGAYGSSYKGMFINFGFELENMFNPIDCECKIQNMIKSFKEKALNNKLNEIEKDFE